MKYYPVFLDLEGQKCTVVGEGILAAEKAATLADAGAVVTVISSRDYRPGDLVGARLVIDASDNKDINRQTWEEAEAAGILVNVVDRPAQCRFIAPAIVRRDPLLIAISTSGESPFLASALRARIERWLGREWGPFTALVGRVRRDLRERRISIADQTKVYRRLIASDVRDLLRSDRTNEAEHRAAALAQTAVHHQGRVALVGNALHPASLMDTKMVLENLGYSLSKVQDGVDAAIRMVTDPKLDGVSGRYYDQLRESRANRQAYDRQARSRLRTLSEQLTGLVLADTA